MMPLRSIIGALTACIMLSGSVRAHGTHDERVKVYSRKVQLDPGDIASRHELALAHVEGGAWELALAELDAAEMLKQPGSDHDFSVTRAKALAVGGKMAEAKAVLDAHLKQSPADTQALLERSRALDALQMPAESLADFRAAMDILKSPDPSHSLEYADKLARQGHPQEAAKVIQKAIKQAGETTSLVLRALDLEAATGQWDAALSRIAFLQNAAPRLEVWIGKRALLLTKAGRDAESRAAWTELIACIDALPNLERGRPEVLQLAKDARHALLPISKRPPNNTEHALNP